MSEENTCDNSLNYQYNSNDDKKQTTIVLDYDLNSDERKEIFQNYDLILCEKCNHKIDKKYNYYYYCKSCYEKETGVERSRIEYGKCQECFQVLTEYRCELCIRKHFQQDFDKWTSRNEGIDKLIQDIRLTKHIRGILEWIPYDKFNDIKYIAEGGFAKVYSATWTDGEIIKWDHKSNNWKRKGPKKVALKVFNNSSNLSEDFINEVFNIKYN